MIQHLHCKIPNLPCFVGDMYQCKCGRLYEYVSYTFDDNYTGYGWIEIKIKKEKQ